jgi:predicted methyltransferase
MEPRYSAYRLIPTAGAPALVVDGVLMHRVQGVRPDIEAREKVRALGIRGGRVLDTCAGLGYSAIAAAEAGAHVLAIEVDPGVVAVARQNPASAALFSHAGVALVMADSAELVAALPDGAFAAVLHDPPTLARAGDLYAGSFYEQLHRVLAWRGRLFHYTGEPGAARGRDVAAGVVRRLERAGFRARVEQRLAGVVAEKRVR